MRRRVFIILSSRSLPYANKCFISLFQNALEPLDVTLLTDSDDDVRILSDALCQVPNPNNHSYSVFSADEAEQRAQDQWSRYPNLINFRHGHPCWHKVTDPILFSKPGEEAIVLDPDLIFPNKFTFEPSPEKGVSVMWQAPSCLLPDYVVQQAFDKGIKLAHHVDIGVAHIKEPIDLDWYDWFVESIGGDRLPKNIMHIEAITWAALAMKMGGGYLTPDKWLCYRNNHWKRLLLKTGLRSSRNQLRKERIPSVKCFHGGGDPKWWIANDDSFNYKDGDYTLDKPSPLIPFVELSPKRFKLEQATKKLLRSVGYYAILNPSK